MKWAAHIAGRTFCVAGAGVGNGARIEAQDGAKCGAVAIVHGCTSKIFASDVFGGGFAVRHRILQLRNGFLEDCERRERRVATAKSSWQFVRAGAASTREDRVREKVGGPFRHPRDLRSCGRDLRLFAGVNIVEIGGHQAIATS